MTGHFWAPNLLPGLQFSKIRYGVVLSKAWTFQKFSKIALSFCNFWNLRVFAAFVVPKIDPKI